MIGKRAVFFFLLLFFPLSQVVSAAAAPTLALASQDHLQLQQCEQGEFFFELSNPDATAVETYSFSLTGLDNVDHSGLPTSVQLMPGETQRIRLTVWPKCGDATATGKHDFYLTATSASSVVSVHASASFTVANPRSLSATLVALDSPAACAGQSADYRLELRNNGAMVESGSLLASSPYAVSMLQDGFTLQPGEVTYRDIVVDVPSNATGTGLLTVSIIPFGEPTSSEGVVKSVYSAIPVEMCRGITIEGIKSIEMCIGESLRATYVIRNNGTSSDFVYLSSTRGQISTGSLSMPAHSVTSFYVDLYSNQFSTPGQFNVTVQANGGLGVYKTITQVNVGFCRNAARQVAITVRNSFANGSLVDIPINADGTADLLMVNPNYFDLTNVLVVQNANPVSEQFNLRAGENKTVPVKLQLPEGFTNGTITLVFESDAGNSFQQLKFARKPSILSGFFTAISNPLIGGAMLLVLIAIIAFGYIRIKQVDQIKAQNELRAHLENYTQ